MSTSEASSQRGCASACTASRQAATVEAASLWSTVTTGTGYKSFHDESGKVTIGREDCMMNFLNDVYMSPKHASVETAGGGFLLTDLESQNGTYVRIEQERALAHGDYVFVGKQLLRVEVTP